MQVASNSAALANLAPSAPDEAQQPSSSADPSEGTSRADSRVERDDPHPPQPWGEPEFMQSPTAGFASLGTATPNSNSDLEGDGATRPGTGSLFGHLPEPSYINDAPHGRLGQVPPRRDRNPSRSGDGAPGFAGALYSAADGGAGGAIGPLNQARKVGKFGVEVKKGNDKIKELNKNDDELLRCIDIPAPPGCPTSAKDLQKMEDKADRSRKEAVDAIRDAYRSGLRVPGTSTGGPVVVKP